MILSRSPSATALDLVARSPGTDFSMNSANTNPGPRAAKRLACDRCRRQKIRCTRVDHNGHPCARCVRSGASCVIGTPLPVGRPRKDASDAHRKAKNGPASGLGARRRQEAKHFKQATQATPANQAKQAKQVTQHLKPISLETPMWSPLEDCASLFGSPISRLGIEDIGNISSPTRSGIPPLSLTEQHDGTIFGLDLLEGDLFLNPLGGLPAHGTNIANLTPANTTPSPLDSIDFLDIDCHDASTPGLETDNYASDCDGPDSASSEEAESGNTAISLSRLNEQLARQMAQVDLYPWRLSLIQGACSKQFDSSNRSDTNPIARALQSSSELLAILQTLTAPVLPTMSTAGDHDYMTSPSPSPLTSPLLSENPRIPHALLLIASYLQLTRLFDMLFHRIHQCLVAARTDVTAGYKPAPAPFPSLPAMHSQLMVKVLIQVVEHHVESVECLLGLPAELRLRGCAGSASGIFAAPDMAMLLRGVVTDAAGETQSAVGALRASIARVQEFLKG